MENKEDVVLAELPNFAGNVYKRPAHYVQDVGSNVMLDEYTVHAYQYATSSRPGFCAPAVIIYAANENDVKLAINYAKNAGVAVAIRSGGHHFWGFSSTSGPNIQVDMSSFESFRYDEETRTFTAGVGLKLGDLDEYLLEVGAFIPHGQCGAVCLGGHMQSGGFSVLCGRSFGWFCDYVTKFRLITASLDIITVTKPDLQNPLEENDKLWFAIIGGSPGNFGVVTEMTIAPLFDEDYPEARSTTIYLPYSQTAHQDLLQIIAEYNDNDELPADFNLSCFVLGKYDLELPSNIDTEMMKHHPEIYGNDPGFHPYIMGIWGSWLNLDGGEYTQEAQDFFADLEEKVNNVRQSLFSSIAKSMIQKLMRLMKALQHHQTVPYLTPDTPISMSALTKSFCFPERVHANPYVSATWCGQSQELTTNGFSEWAASVTNEVYEQPGCFADFEWVICGGKYSKNVTNHQLNPTAVAWRDTSLLCFQYVHFDNTRKGLDWKEPGEFSRNWVERAKEGAIGENGVIGVNDRRWNAFPVQDDNLDNQRLHYFQSEEVYNRVLQVKQSIDPDNIFTPNLFCVGASTSGRY